MNSPDSPKWLPRRQLCILLATLLFISACGSPAVSPECATVNKPASCYAPPNPDIAQAAETTAPVEIGDQDPYHAVSLIFADGKIFDIVRQEKWTSSDDSSSAIMFAQYERAFSGYGYGILAHNNTAAGIRVTELKIGEQFLLLTADGQRKKFEVVSRDSYQAIGPSNYPSRYRELDTGEQFSEIELFRNVFNNNIDQPGDMDDIVEFQTCIEGIDENGNSDLNWGRLFVRAIHKP